MNLNKYGLWVASFLSLAAVSAFSEDAGRPASRAPEGRAEDLYIAPEALHWAMETGSDLFLTDVRAAPDFEASRIPGSHNVPLFTIKTKAFLKGKTAVLIGKGAPSTVLERECRSLRSRGWDVRVLRGGLALWRRKGFPLEGEPARSGANRLAASEYLSEKDARPWLLIDVGSDDGGREFGARRIPFRGSGDAFLSALEEEIKRRGESSSLAVLIGNAEGDYESLEPLIEAILAAENVFYLQGGWNACRAFHDRQAALLNPGRERTCGGSSGCAGQPAQGCATCR